MAFGPSRAVSEIFSRGPTSHLAIYLKNHDTILHNRCADPAEKLHTTTAGRNRLQANKAGQQRCPALFYPTGVPFIFSQLKKSFSFLLRLGWRVTGTNFASFGTACGRGYSKSRYVAPALPSAPALLGRTGAP